MTNIILDTNVIITYPKLLGLDIPDVKFVVPMEVIMELNSRANQRGKSFDERSELIEKSSKQGIISIINSDLPSFQKYSKYLVSNRKLRIVDLSIIASAMRFKDSGEITKIATQDLELIKVANENNIDVLSAKDIESYIDSFKQPEERLILIKEIKDALLIMLTSMFPFSPLVALIIKYLPKLKDIEIPSIQGKIVFFERRENTNLIVGIIIGILFTSLALILYLKLNFIIANINIWGTIVATLFLAIVLFIFREKQRLSYGVFEFLVGAISIVILFNTEQFNYQRISFTLDFSVKLMAGLYIMVRGQDNIVKALKDSKIGIKLKKYGIGN